MLKKKNGETVNRIITLDTPHSGTQLADMYPGAKPLFEKVKKLAIKIGVTTETLDELINLPSENAVFNLQPKGDAIKELNQNIDKESSVPSHAICSYMTGNPEDYGYTSNRFLNLYMYLFAYAYNFPLRQFVPGFGWRTKSFLDFIYDDEHHDGVVSCISQGGGLSSPAMTEQKWIFDGFLGTKSWAHHCMTNKWDKTYKRIEYLLKEPTTSPSFAKGFQPVPIRGLEEIYQDSRKNHPDEARQNVRENDVSDNRQYIKMALAKDSVQRTLHAQLSYSNNISSIIVFAKISDNNYLIGCDSTDYVFSIPDTFEGKLIMYAIGISEDSMVLDIQTVNYERTSNPVYIFYENARDKIVVKGDRFSPNIVVGWDNGEENYVTPNYTTNNEILKIEGSDITALKEGECQLIANYEGLSDTLRVIVVPAQSQPSNIVATKADNENSQISYINGILTVVPDYHYTGEITIEIYNLLGEVCFSEHRMVKALADEPIHFNLLSLPSQLYVARVRMSKESSMKFYKR